MTAADIPTPIISYAINGSYLDPTLEAFVSRKVGYAVHVRCEPTATIVGNSGPDTAAYVDTFTSPDGKITFLDLIHIDNQWCPGIRAALSWNSLKKKQQATFSRPNGVYRMGTGLLILFHEAMHLKLHEVDEGIVECVAIRNIYPEIAALGFPAGLRKKVYREALDAHRQSGGVYKTVC